MLAGSGCELVGEVWSGVAVGGADVGGRYGCGGWGWGIYLWGGLG